MEILDLDVPFPWTEGPPRRKGLHLTDIIQDMAISSGIRKRSDMPEELRKAHFEKGYIWERLLSMAFADQVPVRPGEFICDGIACSPDGILYLEDGIAVAEYKCTFYSSDRDFTDTVFWSWHMQAKGYCHVIGTDLAVFYVLFLKGNHRDEPGPVKRVYPVRYSSNEIEEAWMSIVNHAKMRGWLKDEEA